jgi:PncC family amidohydrolase
MELFTDKKLHQLHSLMLHKKETIAVAESVTSGLLQLAFAQAEEAAKFYQGGITTYNLGQKSRHLHVEPIYAQEVNCVSEKVATEMAVNVCSLFNSDWGIGVTGYATPVPESGEKVFAFYAIAHKNKVLAKGKLNPKCDQPFRIQLKYVSTILDRFISILK